MMGLTPNSTPDGERCGSCRFAGTHTHAQDRHDKIIVRCRRFPPYRRGMPMEPARLQQAHDDTIWAYSSWDDWCGEWQARDPEPDQEAAPVGFRP